MKRTLLAAFLFLGVSAYSQVEVNGLITDKEGESVTGANVWVALVKDTTQAVVTSTDPDGKFRLTLPATGFYKMRVTFVGFTPFTRILRVTDSPYNVPAIQLVDDTRMLDEVQVKDKPIVVLQQGDTTAFLASGFKTNPDATADDLLKKMPGVTIDGSGVQAQGESVQRVLVDGREFFGDDPMATLRSLPAEIIQKIEVFDRQSDESQFSGYNDGNTQKTINIVTKPESRNGNFGRVFGGLGTEAHYNFGGNINFFDDAQRISVVGMSNDINVQNFSSEDLVGVASSSSSGRGRGGGRGRPGRGNATGNFLTGQQNGISDVNSLGLNFVDEWLEGNLKLSGSYFFNNSTNKNDQDSRREYFLSSDSSYFYDDLSSQETKNYNHRFNARMEYRIDEKNMLVISPRFSYQDNTTNLTQQANTLDAGGQVINGSINRQLADRNGLNFSNNLVYRRGFEIRGRTLSLRVRNTYLKNDGLTTLDAINIYAAPIEADSIEQETTQFSLQKSVDARLTYADRIGEKWQWQLSQGYAKTWNESEAFNFNLRTEQPELDSTLSNVFDNTFTRYTTAIGLSTRGKKGYFRAALDYQHAELASEQFFPAEGSITRSYDNLLPSLFSRINISKTKNLRIFYRTNTDEPSISQLQNVVDNSNPILLTTGNPELDQAYMHRAVIRYSSVNTEKANSIYAYVSAQHGNDYISNETIIAEREDINVGGIVVRRGSQLTRPVNVDGYWNLNGLLTYSIPWSDVKSILNLNIGANYIRTPGLINGQLNTSKSYGTSLGLVIASNISERVDFTIGYTGNFNLVDNSLQPELDNNYLNSVATAGLTWIFGKDFVFRTDVNYQRYDGLSEGFNQNYVLWNASFGKKFMKDNRGELSVSAFDILKQNRSITRTVTETYIEDASNVVLQQYFMLNFMYTIKNFRG